MHRKNIIRLALATAGILAIPLLGSIFSDGYDWGLLDFIFAGSLLFGTGLAYELLSGKSGNIIYRAAMGAALAATLFLVWVNVAVGIIGSEDNPANLLYAGVLAVEFSAAAIARLKPQGMSRAMFATAIAQASVPIIAFIIWKPPVDSPEMLLGMIRTFGANTIFVLLFAGSALLFRRAGARTSNVSRKL